MYSLYYMYNVVIPQSSFVLNITLKILQ